MNVKKAVPPAIPNFNINIAKPLSLRFSRGAMKKFDILKVIIKVIIAIIKDSIEKVVLIVLLFYICNISFYVFNLLFCVRNLLCYRIYFSNF